jgi:hypothetical protein
VCEFFSAGGVRTPLVLDDVFVTSDDARFDHAMNFLAETSTRHQTILLSCQTRRHLAWRERHPDLFDARFALLELPSGEGHVDGSATLP